MLKITEFIRDYYISMDIICERVKMRTHGAQVASISLFSFLNIIFYLRDTLAHYSWAFQISTFRGECPCFRWHVESTFRGKRYYYLSFILISDVKNHTVIWSNNNVSKVLQIKRRCRLLIARSMKDTGRFNNFKRLLKERSSSKV